MLTDCEVMSFSSTRGKMSCRREVNWEVSTSTNSPHSWIPTQHRVSCKQTIADINILLFVLKMCAICVCVYVWVCMCGCVCACMCVCACPCVRVYIQLQARARIYACVLCEIKFIPTKSHYQLQYSLYLSSATWPTEYQHKSNKYNGRPTVSMKILTFSSDNHLTARE